MAKTKSSKRKQQTDGHARNKPHKRAGRRPITRTAAAAGLAFSVSGVLQGCAGSETHERDATAIDASGDVAVYAILAPADASRDSKGDRDVHAKDAGEDVTYFAILPPADSGADGKAIAILAPVDASNDGKDAGDATVVDAGKDVTIIAILPPADASRDSEVYAILPIPIMPISILPPNDSGFYGII